MEALDRFEAIARSRRSVRAFLSQPVERTVIERAIEIAGSAPSSCNTQPWRVHIASGSVLHELRLALTAAAEQRMPPLPEVASAEPYKGVYRERQVEAAKRLFAAQGVERHDAQARARSFLRNYAFFDAPHAAFLFIPEKGGLREAADCGKFAQTFMLALAAAGIGSCPQGSLADYPMIVRNTLLLDEPGRLLFGISFGYPDQNDASANVQVPKAPVSDVVTFHHRDPAD